MCRPGGRLIYRPPITQPQHKPEPVKQHACPLTGVEANVIIRDFCASIALTQKFQNTEDVPIEAVYQFPLNEKYCICDFTAEIDGKVIKGECKEKEEAKDIYDDAISEGHGAYLLEQEDDSNIFKVNVGNLSPGKEVNVTITYVAELEFVEGVLQWILPTTKEEEGPASSYYRSTTSKAPLPGLKLKVDLDMTSNIRSLSSPSHPISFEFGEEPTKATVTLGDSSELVQKDFVLAVKLAKPHQPCAGVQKDSKGNLAAMVALYPEIKLEEDEEIYTEMIFLVDRSGSMGGSRINQVRDTMQIFLRSIGEGTMFNIVGFGTRSDFLFKNGSVEYNDKNLDIATKHVASMSANLGGTNILKPLQEILQSPTVEGYPRQLFILTDGEVSNTQQCIDYVRKNSHTTRVFTFGIGNEASQELVKGMAKAGEGFYEFIMQGENMEAKVMKQLGRAMQPALTDISVDWGEMVVEQAPYRLPPLFLGGRLVVYGFLPEGTKEGKVTLKAKTAIKPFETSVDLKPEEAKEGTLFHKLGAKQLIRDLQEARSFMHTTDGALIPTKTAEHVKKEMIRLSTNYGVLCEHTSFVAVEERSEATEGTMQVRKIGIEKAPKQPHAGVAVPLSATSLGISGPTNFHAGSHVGWAPPPPQPVVQKNRERKSGGLFKSKKDKRQQKSVPPPTRMAMKPVASPSRGGSGASMGPSAPLKAAPCAPPPAPKCQSRSMAPPPPPAAAAPCSPSSFSAPPRSSEDRLCRRSSSECAKQPIQLQSDSFAMSESLCKQQEILCGDAEDLKKEEEAVEAPPAEMRTIIMKQKASGSWALGDVSSLLGSLSAEGIKKAIAALVQGEVTAEVEAVWVTAVVVAFLQIRFPRQKTNWDLVVKKAKRWISKQAKAVSVKPEGFDFVAQATKYVETN